MTTLIELPRLCTLCKSELESTYTFCSNCGLKFHIPTGDVAAKAKEDAERRITKLLSSTSLKSLKEFRWVQEKQAMYGLPIDRNKKIKYLKMDGVLKSIKPVGPLSPVKSPPSPKKNVPGGKNVPRPPSRSISPKSRAQTPKTDNIHAPVITNASTSQFLTDIVTTIDEHYIKINGGTEGQIERELLMEKKILLTNIFEFRHSQNIDENDRQIKQIIGRESRKIDSRDSHSQFNRSVPKVPLNGRDIGDVSNYLDDIGSVKDLYRDYVEREKLLSGLIHKAYENHGFGGENRLTESSTVGTPFAYEKNPKISTDKSNNAINSNNDSNNNNDNNDDSNNDYMSDNGNENHDRHLDPSSSEIKESWFWGPTDHYDIPDGDEGRTGVLWTAVLTGYEGSEDSEDDENGKKSEGEKVEKDEKDENEGGNREKEGKETEKGGEKGGEKVAEKVAEKCLEKRAEKSCEKGVVQSPLAPGIGIRNAPYHIYSIIARMFKKICTDIKLSLVETEIEFFKDYSIKTLFQKIMILKKSVVDGIKAGTEIKKEYELFCLRNIRRKAEANGIVAHALKLAVSAYNSFENDQIIQNSKNDNNGKNGKSNQNVQNAHDNGIPKTHRSQISRTSQNSRNGVYNANNSLISSLQNSFIIDDNLSIGSSVTYDTERSSVFNVPTKSDPKNFLISNKNKNKLKNIGCRIIEEGSDSIYESIYDSNNSDIYDNVSDLNASLLNNNSNRNNHRRNSNNNNNTNKDSNNNTNHDRNSTSYSGNNDLSLTTHPLSPSRLKLMKGKETARAKAAVRKALMGEGSQLLQLQREESYLLLRIKEDEETTIRVIDTWLPRLRQNIKCCQIAEVRTYAVLQHKGASLIQKLVR